MIAAGLTNREIAEQLVISPETVKKHTASIFGKLGVGTAPKPWPGPEHWTCSISTLLDRPI